MQITDELVLYVAELSRIKLDDASKGKMKCELESILEHMDTLNQLDTTGVEPLSHIFDVTNVMREDKVKPSFPREDILCNAPTRTEDTFVVPKTVD